MSDLMGLGIGVAAMGTMVPEVGEVLKGFNAGMTGSLESMDSVRCPNCGNLLPAGAKFCTKCGTKME